MVISSAYIYHTQTGCVKSPFLKEMFALDTAIMPGISRACYNYSECPSVLNNSVSSNLLENIQSQFALIKETIKNLMASLINFVSK